MAVRDGVYTIMIVRFYSHCWSCDDTLRLVSKVRLVSGDKVGSNQFNWQCRDCEVSWTGKAEEWVIIDE